MKRRRSRKEKKQAYREWWAEAKTEIKKATAGLQMGNEWLAAKQAAIRTINEKFEKWEKENQ